MIFTHVATVSIKPLCLLALHAVSLSANSQKTRMFLFKNV